MLFLKKRLKQHCKNLCFGPTLCPKMYKLRGCWRKTIKKTLHFFFEACSISLQGLNQKTCGVGGPPREAGWIHFKGARNLLQKLTLDFKTSLCLPHDLCPAIQHWPKLYICAKKGSQWQVPSLLSAWQLVLFAPFFHMQWTTSRQHT